MRGATVSQDVRFRDLQERGDGGHLVQAAMDHGLLYVQNAPADPVVIPVAPLEGAIDLSAVPGTGRRRVSGGRLCSPSRVDTRRPWLSPFGRKRPGGFLTLKGMAQNGESARVCGGV